MFPVELLCLGTVTTHHTHTHTHPGTRSPTLGTIFIKPTLSCFVCVHLRALATARVQSRNTRARACVHFENDNASNNNNNNIHNHNNIHANVCVRGVRVSA